MWYVAFSDPGTLHATRGFTADLLADLQVGRACLGTSAFALVVVRIGYHELLFDLIPLAAQGRIVLSVAVWGGFQVSVCALGLSALSISMQLLFGQGQFSRSLARLLYDSHADE